MLFRGKTQLSLEGSTVLEDFCVEVAEQVAYYRLLVKAPPKHSTRADKVRHLKGMFAEHDKLTRVYQRAQAFYVSNLCMKGAVNVFGEAHNALGTPYRFYCRPKYEGELGSVTSRGTVASHNLYGDSLAGTPNQNKHIIPGIASYANKCTADMKSTMVIRMHNPNTILEYFNSMGSRRLIPCASVNIDGKYTWSKRGGAQTNNGVNIPLKDADDVAYRIDKMLDGQMAIAGKLMEEQPVGVVENFMLGCMSSLAQALAEYNRMITAESTSIIKQMQRRYPNLLLPSDEMVNMAKQEVEYYTDNCVVSLGAPPVTVRKAQSMKFDVITRLVAEKKITVTLPRWFLSVQTWTERDVKLLRFKDVGITDEWKQGRAIADKWLTAEALKL